MTPRTLSLTEYQPTAFSATAISTAEGESLWQHWQKKVNAGWPSLNQAGCAAQEIQCIYRIRE